MQDRGRKKKEKEIRRREKGVKEQKTRKAERKKTEERGVYYGTW